MSIFKKKPSTKPNFYLGFGVGVITVVVIGLILFLVIKNNHGVDLKETTKTTPVSADRASSRIYTFDISQGSDHILGNFEAPVTMVVFTDFECSYCASFHQTYTQLLQDKSYQDKIRVVWRHYPLDSIHPQARVSSVASECVAQQDQAKFWAFADRLFDNQQNLNQQFFQQSVQDLGLDVDKFKSCLSDPLMHGIVEAHYQEGFVKGVRGTPINFINGKEYKGSIPLGELKNIVDKELGD